jgi:hypothetical protein
MYDEDSEMSQLIRDSAYDLATGKESRWNEQRTNYAKDQVFSATLGRVKTDIRAADAGAVRRGMFRSGMAQRTENDLRRGALTAYSQGVKEIMMKKMDAEFEDKMAGLKLSQDWLSQKQNYELGKERNAIAREQIAATMASAQLSAQVAREGIAASRGAAAAQMRFNEQQAASSNAWKAMEFGKGLTPQGGYTSNYGQGA